MNIQKTDEKQQIKYDGNSYIFKLKLKEENKINNKQLNNNKKNNDINIHNTKQIKYKINDNNIFDINHKEKNKNINDKNLQNNKFKNTKEIGKNIDNPKRNENNILETKKENIKTDIINNNIGNTFYNQKKNDDINLINKNNINNNPSHAKIDKNEEIKVKHKKNHNRNKSAPDFNVEIQKDDLRFPDLIPQDYLQFSAKHANGLENVGATCYMNATLQCLVHIQKLTNYFLNPEKQQKILSNKKKYKLTNAYFEVLKNLWKNNSIKFYSPVDFKNVISEMNPLFAGIQANDSKDLILFLLETMHNELNKANKINPQNEVFNQYDYDQTLKLFIKYFQNNYQSIISDIFYGMYNSTMKCLNCKIVTHNIQCYNILIFPLEEVRKFKKRQQNVVNITECFEYYQKDDYMAGGNQIYCNHCKLMSNSINNSQLIICPKVLVINLNRGKGLQFNIKIKLDQYLDLKNFINKKSVKKSPSYYELIGIVTHFGPSNMGGHFIAFCKSFKDQNWYKYNDTQVNISSFEEAKTLGDPYILFYSYIKK